MTAAPGRYLLEMAATVALLGGLYTLMFLYQLGAPVAAEYWVYEAKVAKLHVASRIKERKLVVLGGSSALFSIDSRRLEEATGLPTVNLAIHAGLWLPYVFDYAKPVLASGDVVILMLEYPYYGSPNPAASWFAGNVMAWDAPYVRNLGWLERLRLLLSVPAKRVANGVVAELYESRLRRTHGRLVRDPADILREAEKIWEGKLYRERSFGYAFQNMNERGDIQNNRGTTYAPHPERRPAYARDAVETIRAFADYCAARGITLLIAWPAAMRVPDLQDPAAQTVLAEVADGLRRMGLRVLGSPGDFFAERRYFFNTIYHSNEEGRQIVTGKLVEELRRKGLN